MSGKLDCLGGELGIYCEGREAIRCLLGVITELKNWPMLWIESHLRGTFGRSSQSACLFIDSVFRFGRVSVLGRVVESMELESVYLVHCH